MNKWLPEGGYMNHVLYKMCAEQPKHEDAAMVEGKIQLIGRAYSASPGRGIKIDKFYPRLAQVISRHGNALDEKILVAQAGGRISRELLPVVVDAHDFLNRLIGDFIRDNLELDAIRKVGHRRSFCSKYLHFHAPMAFPILDSVAEDALRDRRREKRYKNTVNRSGVSGRYASFCRHFLSYAETCHDPDRWTPRSVDGELWPYPILDTLKTAI